MAALQFRDLNTGGGRIGDLAQGPWTPMEMPPGPRGVPGGGTWSEEPGYGEDTFQERWAPLQQQQPPAPNVPIPPQSEPTDWSRVGALPQGLQFAAMNPEVMGRLPTITQGGAPSITPLPQRIQPPNQPGPGDNLIGPGNPPIRPISPSGNWIDLNTGGSQFADLTRGRAPDPYSGGYLGSGVGLRERNAPFNTPNPPSDTLTPGDVDIPFQGEWDNWNNLNTGRGIGSDFPFAVQDLNAGGGRRYTGFEGPQSNPALPPPIDMGMSRMRDVPYQTQPMQTNPADLYPGGYPQPDSFNDRFGGPTPQNVIDQSFNDLNTSRTAYNPITAPQDPGSRNNRFVGGAAQEGGGGHIIGGGVEVPFPNQPGGYGSIHQFPLMSAPAPVNWASYSPGPGGGQMFNYQPLPQTFGNSVMGYY